MMMIKGLFSGLAAVVAAGAATGAGDNPMLGRWDWNPVKGQCHEVHTYSADGTARSESGTEVLIQSYVVTKMPGGWIRVDTTVVSGNGGKDCTGSPTPVGAKSTVYVMFQNYGGYLTCGAQDGMSCYGSAAPKK
ncbi:hypothetical protein [Asticcacaulis solisilvae]|uniref:hypothetical protein n=1 Tax=Asticcacaulis solisilvae TaxID=1217274 RepID=UPI003FD805CF